MNKNRIFIEMVDFEEFYDGAAIKMIKESLLRSVTKYFELRIWSARAFNGMPWPTLSIVPVAKQEGWNKVAQRINKAHCSNIVIYGSTAHSFGFPVITTLNNINNFVLARKMLNDADAASPESTYFNVFTKTTLAGALYATH